MSTAPGAPPGAHHPSSGRPNIVFVLTDDLSMDLLPYMPHVLAMERDGLTFKDYFVSDSLCCPSRASIFTGDFPHDTGVFGNFGPAGGFHAFYTHGEENHTFAVALSRAGYPTAMMGKYLNGYLETRGQSADGSIANVPGTYVPPGWSQWDVAGWGYPEFNYTLNENGRLYYYGDQASDYLTDVIASQGVDFINRSARTGRPFFLELATFAPHSPYTPGAARRPRLPRPHGSAPAQFRRAADPRTAVAGGPSATRRDSRSGRSTGRSASAPRRCSRLTG